MKVNVYAGLHKHDWVEYGTRMGYSSFPGAVDRVRVKGIVEQCTICKKFRGFAEDGNGTRHPMPPEWILKDAS